MIPLVIHGASGRMGRRIDACAQDDDRFTVAARIDRDSAPDDNRVRLPERAVVIDFSTDEGAQCAAELAVEHRAALLVGTTGLSAQTLEKLGGCAQLCPVMIAPNTSRGIAVMSHLLARAAAAIGMHADVDLIESHHAQKRDAPSGTALRLAAALRDSGVNLPDDRIHVVRAGDIPGEHMVQFACAGERLQIAHLATSRDVFARGALDAAAWLHAQKPGQYRIEQSLGLDV